MNRLSISSISGWVSPASRKFGKIFKDNGLPRFPILHILFAAIAKIQCSRLVLMAKEHERMSADRGEPKLPRRDGDGQVGSFQRAGEISRQDKTVGQTADFVDTESNGALPLWIAAIGGGKPLDDGEAVAVSLECLIELTLRLQHVADLVVGQRQVALPARIAASAAASRSRMASPSR